MQAVYKADVSGTTAPKWPVFLVPGTLGASNLQGKCEIQVAKVDGEGSKDHQPPGGYSNQPTFAPPSKHIQSPCTQI